MEQRLLGDTGLHVSALSFGTMTFGGGDDVFGMMGTSDVTEARSMIDGCLEAGVTLFDTADVYSHGRSEEILGAALGARRDDVLIATKAHGRVGAGPNDVGQSRHHLVRSVEASLRRLGTDRIDLLQMHGLDALTSVEETLRALDDLVRSGKVRYVGVSNWPAWRLMATLGVAERRGFVRPTAMQVQYHLLARDVEHELVPLARDQRVGMLVWGPLAGGLLTGKFRRGQTDPAGTRRAQLGDVGPVDVDQGHAVVDVLDDIAAQHRTGVAQTALAWLLHRPGVTSVIVGARTPEQLRTNLGAADVRLTDDEMARLDAVSARPLPYPAWVDAQANAERNPPSPAVRAAA